MVLAQELMLQQEGSHCVDHIHLHPGPLGVARILVGHCDQRLRVGVLLQLNGDFVVAVPRCGVFA